MWHIHRFSRVAHFSYPQKVGKISFCWSVFHFSLSWLGSQNFYIIPCLMQVHIYITWLMCNYYVQLQWFSSMKYMDRCRHEFEVLYQFPEYWLLWTFIFRMPYIYLENWIFKYHSIWGRITCHLKIPKFFIHAFSAWTITFFPHPLVLHFF